MRSISIAIREILTREFLQVVSGSSIYKGTLDVTIIPTNKGPSSHPK